MTSNRQNLPARAVFRARAAFARQLGGFALLRLLLFRPLSPGDRDFSANFVERVGRVARTRYHRHS